MSARAGWARIGRTPTNHPGATRAVLAEAKPPAPPAERPPTIDLATLPREGRKPFDADKARAAAGAAL